MRTTRLKRSLPATRGRTTRDAPATSRRGSAVPERMAKPRAVPSPMRLYWLRKAWARKFGSSGKGRSPRARSYHRFPAAARGGGLGARGGARLGRGGGGGLGWRRHPMAKRKGGGRSVTGLGGDGEEKAAGGPAEAPNGPAPGGSPGETGWPEFPADPPPAPAPAAAEPASGQA